MRCQNYVLALKMIKFGRIYTCRDTLSKNKVHHYLEDAICFQLVPIRGFMEELVRGDPLLPRIVHSFYSQEYIKEFKI